jgi:hypothetical protein
VSVSISKQESPSLPINTCLIERTYGRIYADTTERGILRVVQGYVCPHHITQPTRTRPRFNTGMASPLLGIAGVNSLLFASYGISKRIISPYPLSLKEIAVAGAMAGAANAILASPGSAFPPENLVTPRC